MTAFKNTIVGKILRGVSKVAVVGAAVAGTVATAGALAGTIPSVVTGVGLLGKIAGAGKKVISTVSKIGEKAVNLVTGTTKAERQQIGVVKAESKAQQDKLDQIERLVNAGATRSQAQQMVGVTPDQLGAPAEAEGITIQQGTGKFIPVSGTTGQGTGCFGPAAKITTTTTVILFILYLVVNYLIL